MEVYVEYAFIENFCMDFTLLYSAKLVVKNGAGFKKIALGGLIGAVFAVVFPLFKLPVWASVSVKIISGLLMCLAAGKFSRVKSYVKFSAAFLGFSFVLGGALIAAFSLAGVNFTEGGGFILSSVPVGIPLFCALTLIIAARSLAKKFSKGNKIAVECNIIAAGGSVKLKGFFDSGNRVYFKGAPVSIIPRAAAEKIVDTSGIKDCVKIHTVTGSKTVKVFTAEKIEFVKEGTLRTVKNVKLGVSGVEISEAVLHADLLED